VADAQPPQEQQEVRSPRPGLTPLSLLIVLIIFYLFVQIQIVVFLLLFAILFATVIERPIIQLEKRGMPRAGGILTIYASILVIVVGTSLLIAPLVTAEARAFWEEVPVIVDDVAEGWRTSDNQFLATTGYRLMTQLQFRMVNPPPPTGDTAIGLVTGIGGAIFGVIATFVIAFYYLMEKRLFKRLLLVQLTPTNRDRINAIWNDVESKVGDWLRGQLLLMLIIGVFAGIGYGLLGVRFWLLLALWAGLTELIPIIGPWIGGIPAVAIALLDSWQKAAIVAVFLMLLQLAENTILVPRIMKGTIGLSPLTVFIAVLAGGQYMGPIGALLALPIAAALQVIIQDALRVRQQRFAFDPAVATPAPETVSGWRSIVGQFRLDSEPADKGGSAPAKSMDPEIRGDRPRADAPEGDTD
jgi:predicted PurR-regulated permease PerM